MLLYIAYTGGITLFIAATIAMVQTDYKKVLAYSTVSQLGFMMLGLGVGGWAAGLFHLLTHAFFKALLFLGAGSVYHSVHTYEMPALGGLRKKMPITGMHDARRHAGDLGRAVLQRVLLEGRDPGGRAGPGARRAPSTSCCSCCRRSARCSRRSTCSGCGSWSSPASRAGSPRRPTAAMPTLPTRSTPGTTHRRPRRQAIQVDDDITAMATTATRRPRPRERADHDLAADHPGRLEHLRRLDVWCVCR